MTISDLIRKLREVVAENPDIAERDVHVADGHSGPVTVLKYVYPAKVNGIDSKPVVVLEVGPVGPSVDGFGPTGGYEW